MRIVSKFQDYYDSGLAYGIDHELVYERHTDTKFVKTEQGSNTREDRLNNNAEHGLRAKRYIRGYGHIGRRKEQHYLHFCGKVYPFYYINCEKKYKRGKGVPPVTENSVFHRSRGSNDSIVDYWNEFVWNEERALKHFEPVNAKSLNCWQNNPFDYSKEWDIRDDDTINQRYQSPIVLEFFGNRPYPLLPLDAGKTYGCWYIVNPCLKDIGFGEIVDPYEAFQQIIMYIAALQNPEDKDLDPVASDLDKVRSHSMDEKYRFPKPPKK